MTICKDTGLKASPNCPNTAVEYFTPDAIMNPQDVCTYHDPLPTPTPAATAPSAGTPGTPGTTAPAVNGG